MPKKFYSVSHPTLLFNNVDDSQADSQEHLGGLLDSKLTFHDHLDIVFTKVRKTIRLLLKLNSILLMAALNTIKIFFDLTSGIVISCALHDKLESI